MSEPFNYFASELSSILAKCYDKPPASALNQIVSNCLYKNNTANNKNCIKCIIYRSSCVRYVVFKRNASRRPTEAKCKHILCENKNMRTEHLL